MKMCTKYKTEKQLLQLKPNFTHDGYSLKFDNDICERYQKWFEIYTCTEKEYLHQSGMWV